MTDLRMPSQPGLLGVLLLIGSLVGCTPDLPSPVVQAVHPGWGFNGEDTLVELQGQGFYPRVQISGSDRVELDHQFVIVLETDPETELEGVEIVDYRHLWATVPAGIEVGTYGLRVEGPTGAVGSLADAFEVRDSRADQLRVTPADGQLSWRVLEYASLTIELVDPDGARVAEDLAVQVTVDGTEVDSIEFQADTLDDQAPLSDSRGISGRLGPDGVATLALTSTAVAEAVILRIEAEDPDSGIAGTLQILSFTPGDVAGVRIELPSPVFDTTAGTSFEVDLSVVDISGNVVEGADTLLIVEELCRGGTLHKSSSFVGQTTGLDLRVTRATLDGCSDNALVAFGLSAGAYVEGQSNLFQVAPAEADGLLVDVWPSSVVAGQDEVLAAITAVDEWDNRAVDTEGPVELEASADGGSFGALAWSACYDLEGGEGYCRAILEQAGQDVVLLATTTGPEGLTGVSSPFTVLPGDPAVLTLQIDDDPVVAGEPFELDLEAQDSLGNGVSLDPLGADVVTFSDDEGDLVCDWDRTDEDTETQVYICTMTVAGPGRVIEAELPSYGLSVSSDPVDVVNGELGRVEFVLGASTVVAGDELAVQLRGTDAWGNPYVVQDDPQVELGDDTGDVVPAVATLGSDGRVELDVVITVAAEDDRLVATQDGEELGSSDPFDVVAGGVVDLAIVLPQTFAWLDEGLVVEVQAVDSYGNIAADHVGAVTLRSLEGWGDDIVISSLDDGWSVVSFAWTQAGLSDTLVADDGTLSTSASVDVLDDGCALPPVADLTVDGDSPAVLCRLMGTGSTRTATVSAAGSTAGGAALVRYHLRDTDGGWSVGGGPTWGRSWDSNGGRWLAVVVADADACADRAEVDVFVGDPDGTPTGPVGISLADDTLRAGDTTSDGYTTAELSATDCGGDPAASGQLLARVDLGAIEIGGDVVSTGKGLQVTLDGAGTASITWTAADERYGGSGTLMVGLAEATASGSAAADIINDSVRPAVTNLSPVGTTNLTFDSLWIRFSEDILPGSVTPAAVELWDAEGTPVSLEVGDLDLDGSDLVLTLPETFDAALGIYRLRIASTLRDLDGNRLDGAWTDSRSDFELSFGDVPDDAPDLTSCHIDTDRIRPDGDDGLADEADSVTVTVAAAEVPTWWRLRVSDEDGDVVRTRWIPEGSSSLASLTWDGRGDDGRVVANGAHAVRISPADDAWNTGTSCSVEVTVDNKVVGP